MNVGTHKDQSQGKRSRRSLFKQKRNRYEACSRSTRSSYPEISDLPPCHIRESRRAKYVSIKVSTRGDVEVVVPVGFDQHQIPDILRRRLDWIRAAQTRIQSERSKSDSSTFEELPQEVLLRALNETWTISYEAIATSNVMAEIKAPQHLSLTGRIDQIALCQSVLSQWIRSYARYHLSTWLEHLSSNCELSFSGLTVRRQKTRWGSCSNKANINLNDKLLFLPPKLVRYVLIHELCHTVHLNHSKKFWALVEHYESNYRYLDRELRTAWRYIPYWLTV